MGMTDKQYEALLRNELRDLKRIRGEMAASDGKKSDTLDDREKDLEALLKRL